MSARGRDLRVDLALLMLLPTPSQVVNFPPALYEYVTGELGLALVLVLNKVDLAPPALVVAWKHYFHQHFPQLHIVLFTSFPRDPRIPQDHSGGEWAVRRAAGKVGWQGTKRGTELVDKGYLRMVAGMRCANPFIPLDHSVEEESEAGERMGSGPGAGAAAESL